MSLDQLVHSPPDLALQAPPPIDEIRQDVVMLRWPAQEDLREELEVEGHPRLLLIARDCLAPVCVDALEDWVREPLDSHELEARVVRLRHRARIRALRPRVDESGLVRAGERWIDLPKGQLSVVRLLISEFGRVVSVDRIRAAYLGAGGSTHPKAVKAMIGRVRRRLAVLGLILMNVRDRGYVLEAVAPAGAALPRVAHPS